MTTDNASTAPVHAVVHSPGPWKTCGASDEKCQCGLIWSVPLDCVVAQSVSREDDESINCGDGVSREQATVNGRLIAAAPDLLAALKNFVETVELVDPGVYRDAIDEAEAAIVKASGVVE